MKQGQKNKVPVIGTSILNIAEYAPLVDQREFELSLPLSLSSGASETCPLLCVSLSLLELRTTPEISDSVQSPVLPAETAGIEKDDISAIKAGLRKVKIFTEYVSTRRAKKKACREEEGGEGRCSTGKCDLENNYNYPFDSDSLDEFEEGEFDEGKEDVSVRKSFSYGTLAYANCGTKFSGEDEDWIYYSHRKSDVGCSDIDDSSALLYEIWFPRRSILPWRKRKSSFRSLKPKGEPLLKKDYGEEGGDDIDHDRRQLSSDEAHPLAMSKMGEDSSANRSSFSEFGDDNFAIGSWESKEVINRDGNMKLKAQVFLASIDQRSERAAGESACTALVAVIANWFQTNPDLMPIKSQFDSLIREGSSEWRTLCENGMYMEKFPDKHFDLETVLLQAKIRPLTVVPGKSFIGFFHPHGINEGRFEFLEGAMSFDNIWDEISGASEEESSEPRVYIVSWNDHFFVLKVEPEAYYIIDTLGERLYEGCNQAYILKFDDNTVIQKLPNDEKPLEKGTEPDKMSEKGTEPEKQSANDGEDSKETEEIVCRGKESCKEYIKNFLASIPIRELQEDIKKGIISTTPLHHRLQIEFHYTTLVIEQRLEASSRVIEQRHEVTSTAVSDEVTM
ncbi:PREDICTED: uncharacterized protein LOC104826797 isoform X2 [Tarenaya hassleriana]|nr:PREDICTED: uncharacterized protein LOC104826797 isoform X2 [Tarenaya hassleriana]